MSNRKMVKSCGECTKCCEGWLSDIINGIPMHPGKACYLLKNNKCSDYENRPENPCKIFKCVWLENIDIPNEFIPSKIGVIITHHKDGGFLFIKLHNAPNEPSDVFLNWITDYAFKTKRGIILKRNNKIEYLGSDSFIEFAKNRSYSV